MTLETLPQQFLPTEQVFNLRDVGGLDAADGKKVKTGRVFRSDNFGQATEADIDYIVNELGVRHVIDLRRPAELEQTGRFPEIDGVAFHHFELLHISWESVELRVYNDSPEEQIVDFLRQRYSGMMEAGYLAVRDSLDVIAGGEPVVFHCMAGKDRTGIVAALIEDLVGVPRDLMLEDYMLSNDAFEKRNNWYYRGTRLIMSKAAADSFRDMYRANEYMLTDMLDYLEKTYGGTEGFFREALGFSAPEVKAFKQKILQ